MNEQTIVLMFEKLPPGLQEEYISIWKEESAQRSKEAQVVKLADRLSLISKCHEEMRVGNVFSSNRSTSSTKEDR